MSYKEQYLGLKKRILRETEAKKMNPLLLSELSNLAFVVGNQVLGDGIHAIILSLIEEFNTINGSHAQTQLKHNLELSQYFALDQSLIGQDNITRCENCEIVLKYTATSICLTNLQANYSANNLVDSNLDCRISRGLIKFYIKQQVKNCFTYIKINVVKLNVVNSLDRYNDQHYQNSAELDKLDNTMAVALNRAQSDAIDTAATMGKTASSTSYGVSTSIDTVNKIINNTRRAFLNPQLDKLHTKHISMSYPSQHAINIANTVANTISTAPSSQNISVVLVPGNEPISLHTGSGNTNMIGGSISSSGTKLIAANLQSNLLPATASIVTDANVAIIPTKNVVADNIQVTNPMSISNKLTKYYHEIKSTIHNTANNLGTTYNNLMDNQQNLTTKAVNFFTNKPTITPVSDNLNVMTNSMANSMANSMTNSVPNMSTVPNISTTSKFNSSLKRFNNNLSTSIIDALVPINEQVVSPKSPRK